jgi:hypothetical protein
MVDKLRRPLTKEEAKWLADFDKEYYSFKPTAEVDKARRAAHVKDVYSLPSLTAFFEDWYNDGELPEGVRSINTWIDPRRPRIEDAICDKVDKDRGRVTSNDVYPGIVKCKVGYRAAFLGRTRLFKTFKEARTWLEGKKNAQY